MAGMLVSKQDVCYDLRLEECQGEIRTNQDPDRDFGFDSKCDEKPLEDFVQSSEWQSLTYLFRKLILPTIKKI